MTDASSDAANIYHTQRRLGWPISCLVMTLLSIICFTPLVIPESEIDPQLAGIPFTLWMGMLITLLMLVMCYIACRVHQETGN